MTGAEQERAERIRRWRAAFVAAHGKPAPGVTYTGRRYRVGSGSMMTMMTGPEMARATVRLEARAKNNPGHRPTSTKGTDK